MNEGKRGSRQQPEARQTSPQHDELTQQAETPPLFPIRFMDCYLYDLNVQRLHAPESHMALLGGAVSAELLTPVPVEPGKMQMGMKVRASVPNAEAPAYVIEATFNGIFDITPGTDAQLVQEFAQSTVHLLLWPYVRELFQSISVRMRVPPIMLATLDTRHGAWAPVLSSSQEQQETPSSTSQPE